MRKKKEKKKETLKSLEKKLENFKKNDIEKACNISKKMIDSYPNNILGYSSFLKLKTNNYEKYIVEDELKELKSLYDKAEENLNYTDGQNLKVEFEEYLYDIKEIENLKKIKKDISSKILLKKIYEYGVTALNQYINELKLYDEKGAKIRSVYDLINGLFLVSCMIYNIIFRNILLFITIPFGIFGVIIIYSFFEGFLKRINISKNDSEKNIFINQKNNLKDLKIKIQKLDELILFLKNSKKDSISKIPQNFFVNQEKLLESDESEIANTIFIALKQNNLTLFTSLIDKSTNLNPEDIYEIMKSFVENKDEKEKYSNDKIAAKKVLKNKLIYMKSIDKKVYALMFFLLLFSIGGILVIRNNFNELNLISFLVACIVGVFKLIIYNIDTGKHASVYETFSDCLLSVVFSMSLSYDLIYTSISKSIGYKYLFIQMPLLFLIISIGFVMLISLIKYKNYYKKISM